MIYEIVKYDENRMIAVVKVGNTVQDLENAQHLPIGLRELSTKDDFERLVYKTWRATWNARVLMKPYDEILENHIIENTGSVIPFSIPIVPVEVAQHSSSDASDSTSTTDVQVL
jgi:hypothetical protein